MKHNFTILFFTLLSFFVCSVAQSEVVTIEGTIKSIDRAGKNITIDRKGIEKEFDLSKNIDTSSLKTGQRVNLKFHLDLEIVVKIDPISNPTIDPDLEKMKGTWLAVAEENSGKKKTLSDVKQMNKLLQIDGDKFELSWLQQKIKGTLKIIPNEQLPAIDLSGKLPTGKFADLRGIYELKDDTFRLCYKAHLVNGDEVDRPKSFKTENGARQICVTFKRQK